MARHRDTSPSPRRRPEVMTWRMGIAVPLCLLMGLFALYFGVTLIAHPDRCDGEAMGAYDLCQHIGRGGENLIPNGAVLGGIQGNLHGREGQIGHNRWYGPLSLAAGILFVAVSLWLGGHQVRELRLRRQLRRDRGSANFPEQSTP